MNSHAPRKPPSNIPTIQINSSISPTRKEPPTAYAQIKIDSDLVPNRGQLRTGVAFDSIPLEIEDKDYACEEMDLRGRARSPSPVIRSRSESPDIDEPFPLFENRLQNLKIDSMPDNHGDSTEFRCDYPTEPIITTPSFSIRARTSKFNDIKPENRRTLLIYITGRRHTWVSIDYTVAKLLRDGDSLVIISRVPFKNHNHDHLQKSFGRAAKNVLKYVEFLSPSDTQFEVIIDLWRSYSTFLILNESVEAYQPNLLMTATRPSSRFSRIQTWNTSRISHRLVKNFPNLPILVIPALTLNEFEVNFFEKLLRDRKIESNLNQLKFTLTNIDDTYSTNPSFQSILSRIGKPEVSTPKSTSPEGSFRTETLIKSQSPLAEVDSGNENFENDTSSVISETSTNLSNSDDSDDSDDSEDGSFENLTRTISDYKTILDKTEEDIDEEQVSEYGTDPFLIKLSRIGDIASKMAEEFKQVRGDESTSLVRTLTGMPSITKTKSLLDDLELNNANSIKNLRKQLEAPPLKNRSIKFDNATPSELKKKPELRPTKSTPNTSLTQFSKSDDEISTLGSLGSSASEGSSNGKKKKSFFGSLFKRK